MRWMGGRVLRCLIEGMPRNQKHRKRRMMQMVDMPSRPLLLRSTFAAFAAFAEVDFGRCMSLRCLLVVSTYLRHWRTEAKHLSPRKKCWGVALIGPLVLVPPRPRRQLMQQPLVGKQASWRRQIGHV